MPRASQAALLKRQAVAGPPPDIAFVAQSTAYISSAGATTHTKAYALTTGSGANRKLIAVASTESTLVTGVTYNGVAGTLAVDVSDLETINQQASIYFWDGDELPNDTASHDLVWTVSPSGQMVGGILEYSNVANGAPEWTDTSIADPTPDVLTGTSTEGALIVACISWGTSAATDLVENQGETQRFFSQGTSAGIGLGAADRVGVAAGTQSTQIVPTGTFGTRLGFVGASFPKAA